MKTNRLYKPLAVIIIIFIVFMIISCAKDDTSVEYESISFVLDWTPNTNHTGIYVAIANGYYEEAGLDVKILNPPEAGAPAFVASGKAQFGVDFQESHGIGLSLPEPLPLTAVAAIISHNNSGIISLKERGINDFNELEGKVYGSWGVPAELAILEQTMADAGRDFSKLKVVEAPAAEPIQMIASGLVDAVWVYENVDVIEADILGVEYNFLRFADTSPVLDYYTPIIIANDDFLKDHPESAKKFMQATAAGYNFAIENAGEAAEILLEAVPELKAELIYKSQELLALTYAAEGGQWGAFDESRWNAFYDWMYGKGIIPSPLESKGFTNDFLEQVDLNNYKGVD